MLGLFEKAMDAFDALDEVYGLSAAA